VIVTLFFGFGLMAVVTFILIKILTAKYYNAMVWKHPDNGGGIRLELFKNKSPNQPFWIKFYWWQFSEKPIYLWYEDKMLDKATNKEIFVLKPYEPQPDATKSPNALYDNVDWECAHTFETVQSKLVEQIKMGMAVIMVVCCIIGVVMLADMLNKNKATSYIPEKTPVTLFINGGLDR